MHQIYLEKKKKKTEEEAEERRKTLSNENRQESEEGSSIKILYKDIENFQEIFENPLVKCHFCMDKFDPLYILKHIETSRDCKSFYGSKFDEFKKEKNRLKFTRSSLL